MIGSSSGSKSGDADCDQKGQTYRKVGTQSLRSMDISKIAELPEIEMLRTFSKIYKRAILIPCDVASDPNVVIQSSLPREEALQASIRNDFQCLAALSQTLDSLR